MLRSEVVEKISLYFRNDNLKECLSEIGNASMLEFIDKNNKTKAEDLPSAKELKVIDRLEQRMNYLKNDVEIDDMRISECSFQEAKDAINEYYSKLVELRHTQKELTNKQQILEENYMMACESKRFLAKTIGNSYREYIDFIVGVADREKKFMIKKTLRQRLRRNVYIRMLDVDLKHTERQRTVFIIYVLSDEAAMMVRSIIESLSGRMYEPQEPANTLSAESKTIGKGAQNLSKANKKDNKQTDTSLQPNKTLESNDTLDKINRRNGKDYKIPPQSSETLESSGNIKQKYVKDINDYTRANNGIAGNPEGDATKKAINLEGQSTEPDDEMEEENIKNIKKTFSDIKKLNKSVERHINKLVKKISGGYVSWLFYLNKEKKLCETINKLNRQENASYLLGEGWILEENIRQLEGVRDSINRGGFTFEIVKSLETHPTYFSTTRFTEAFQGFTNVFGVPKYREINPAIFLIFTFPVMFGAMFGDILHGIFLGIIALFLIFRFDQLNHKCGVFQIILEGRYVVMACAFAAVWFGLLYGDFGSLPVAFFQSQFAVGRTYPFGIDPAWHHATNKTVFINSIKMKLSLIIGFIHMSLGSLISINNAIYFQDKISLLCIAIPQFIVFFLFLGYLVFLCVYKWLVTRNYPSLVNTLIGMYTSPFSINEPMYPGQLYVQLFIFSIILFCIPWMLLSKPIYLIMKRRVPETGMLDLWISSGIHVVEFGLGLISNTSSYLRLWAVSLAHVQLTEVLHQFTIGNKNWIVAIILAPVYIVCTTLLLIGLEGLSACLHALRLNWIEFFSKFYSGGGVTFEPLSFNLNYEDVHNDGN